MDVAAVAGGTGAAWEGGLVWGVVFEGRGGMMGEVP